MEIVKEEISGLFVKLSVITTTLGHGETTSRVNERRVSKNSTNDNRALKLWGEVGKIAIPGKQYTKKGMGYNNAGVHVQT